MVSKENSSAASQRASTQGSAASQRADTQALANIPLVKAAPAILNRAPVAPAAPCTAAVGCTAATEQNAEDVRAKGLVVFLGNLPYDIKPADIMEKVSGCLQVRVITETVDCEESDGTNFRYYDFLKTYAFATLDDLKNVDRLINMPIKFSER